MIGVQNLKRRGSIDPGPVLPTATARWIASNYSGAGSLLDESGNALHATLPGGSNDPKWLPYTGDKYVWLPGLTGNSITTPDSVPLSITGDIDVRVKVALDDWTPAARCVLASKYVIAGNNLSWRLSIETNGNVRFVTSATGVVAARDLSASPGAITDGSIKHIRATLDADNGAGGNDLKLWTSDDGVTWAQIATNTAALATSIFDSTAPVELGIYNGVSDPMTGKLYYADIRNNILDDGTGIVGSFAASGLAAPFATYSDGTNTWTLNRAASGRKLAVVDRPLFLMGTDDYFEVADNALLDFALTDSFTLVFACRTYGTPAATTPWMAKRASLTAGAAAAGWLMYVLSASTAGRAIVDDGALATIALKSAAITPGVATMYAAVRDTAADLFTYYATSSPGTPVTDVTTATSVNAEVLRIGRGSGGAGGAADIEFLGAAIFRRALTAGELATLASELGLAA